MGEVTESGFETMIVWHPWPCFSSQDHAFGHIINLTSGRAAFLESDQVHTDHLESC